MAEAGASGKTHGELARRRRRRLRWWQMNGRDPVIPTRAPRAWRRPEPRAVASTSTQLERAVRSRPDRLVVAGGDGSIAPAAAAAGAGRHPAGRGAGGHGERLRRAARAALRPLPPPAGWRCNGTRLRELELGWMNDERPFVNVASAGLPAPAARAARGLEAPARAARVRSGCVTRRAHREAAAVPRGLRWRRAARRRCLAGHGGGVGRVRGRRLGGGGGPLRRSCSRWWRSRPGRVSAS